jgi:hypothetical protein
MGPPLAEKTLMRVEPVIDPQSSAPAPPPEGDPRAISLLHDLRRHQGGLPRGAALAFERAAFCEAFLDPEPARRVRTFLEGGRP